MLRVESSGSFENTNSFLQRMISGNIYSPIDRIAQEGVAALQAATPQESGVTAAAWTYEIIDEGGNKTLWFNNAHEVDGFNVAIGLQYGHATKGGGYVTGTDYINPALKSVFDKIADAVWKEVQKA